jgi:hypothetical protein
LPFPSGKQQVAPLGAPYVVRAKGSGTPWEVGMQQRKQRAVNDIEMDSRFDDPEDYFDSIGFDLPDNLRRSLPSLKHVASFLVEHDVMGMDEDAFTRLLEEG